MVTVIAILVTDLLLLAVFVSQYRQELSMSVNGSHDIPPLRKKPARRPARPAPAVGPSRQIPKP